MNKREVDNQSPIFMSPRSVTCFHEIPLYHAVIFFLELFYFFLFSKYFMIKEVLIQPQDLSLAQRSKYFFEILFNI